ncbi:MAG: DUF2484 family protein [Litoreibacter sp.]|nr:DUF2484 family protein [Litoreibacter sp.]
MSAALIAAAIWAILSTGVALLPMRFQYAPGLLLLLVAPAIIVWIGYEHGIWVAAAGLAAFFSMFRNPLRYLWRRAFARGEDSSR